MKGTEEKVGGDGSPFTAADAERLIRRVYARALSRILVWPATVGCALVAVATYGKVWHARKVFRSLNIQGDALTHLIFENPLIASFNLIGVGIVCVVATLLRPESKRTAGMNLAGILLAAIYYLVVDYVVNWGTWLS